VLAASLHTELLSRREKERERKNEEKLANGERERERERTRRRRQTIKTPGRGQASQLLEARKLTENNTERGRENQRRDWHGDRKKERNRLLRTARGKRRSRKTTVEPQQSRVR
jgi:hypothetical protein